MILTRISGAVEAETPITSAVDNGIPVLLAIHINEMDNGETISVLRFADGHLAIPKENFDSLRLNPAAVKGPLRDNKSYIRLDDITGLDYSVDVVNQALILQVAPSSFLASTITTDTATDLADSASVTPGGFLNYDLEWMHGSSGLFELGAFNSWGSGTSTALWNGNLNSGWVRLDTTWNLDTPRTMESVRIGDIISRAGTWGRASRLGGVQWTTNFAMQPNFVYFSQPTLRSEVSLPSTFDLYVNNVRQLGGTLPAGPFELPNIPAVTGQGEIQLVVKDLLGRQQTISVPYYASPTLLRAGLHDFSYEIGSQRQNYGIANADYAGLVLSATDRLGITPGFTREIRAEIVAGRQTLGVGGVWLVPEFSTANLSGAISSGTNGNGTLVTAGLDHQTPRLSFSVQTQQADQNFEQTGQDPNTRLRRSWTGRIGLPMGITSLGLSYLDQKSWRGDEVRLASANYSLHLSKLGFFSFYLLKDFMNVPHTTLGFTFTHLLDGNTSMTAESYGYSGSNQSTLQLQRNTPSNEGFGYRLQAGQGDFDRYLANGIWRTAYGDISAETVRTNGVSASRAGFSGGIAAMGGDIFVSRRIDDSFAVVKVGDYPNVRVMRDNQEVTRTNSHGLALVTSLRAYQINYVDIEQADLPVETDIEGLRLKLAPALRTGVYAKFGVARSRSATLKLTGENGIPLAPGTMVRVAGQEKPFVVGFDGMTFITGLKQKNHLVSTVTNQRCELELDVEETKKPMPDLGVRICKKQP